MASYGQVVEKKQNYVKQSLLIANYVARLNNDIPFLSDNQCTSWNSALCYWDDCAASSLARRHDNRLYFLKEIVNAMVNLGFNRLIDCVLVIVSVISFDTLPAVTLWVTFL